jgi:mannose-6-phosphate isomerase-like protein (cupin superfamily)
MIQNPAKTTRPWGSYEIIAEGESYLAKYIEVLPGQSLSLQLHHHRNEHWVVVCGTAKIVCGEEEKLLNPDESLYIPKETKHRLTNLSATALLGLIEVQTGDSLSEDDIVRFEDIYGRA